MTSRPCVLTINGGSSSIRFAVYEAGETLRRRLKGRIDRIGLTGTSLIVNEPEEQPPAASRLAAADHRSADYSAFARWMGILPSSRTATSAASWPRGGLDCLQARRSISF